MRVALRLATRRSTASSSNAGATITSAWGAPTISAATAAVTGWLRATIPPNADTYWVGDAGPGPSLIEANGLEHHYTQKTAGWMAHNVVHFARMLRDRPIPPEGNTTPCRHVG